MFIFLAICIKNSEESNPTAFISDFRSVKPLVFDGKKKVIPEKLDKATFSFESPWDEYVKMRIDERLTHGMLA